MQTLYELLSTTNRQELTELLITEILQATFTEKESVMMLRVSTKCWRLLSRKKTG